MGCAITTAFGSVKNEAKLRAGENALVIGCGGVGLATIQALKLNGASSITVFDLNPDKAEVAKKMGADIFIQTSSVMSEVSQAVGLINEKFNVIIETSGNSKITSLCIDKIADGGRMVLVGQSGPGASIQINNPGEFKV